MTAPKKPAPSKKSAPKKSAPAVVPEPEVPEKTLKERVLEHFDELRSAFAGGWSLEYAVAMHMGPAESHLAVREVIYGDKHMYASWRSIKDARADHFFERAAMQAEKLEREDPGKAGDMYLKLAAKQSPKLYGDKAQIELTGADGGPVESVVKLDPAEAYRRALGKS